MSIQEMVVTLRWYMYWFCDLLRTAITYEDHLNYYLEKLSTNDLVG